jgi:hypothetical protein
MAKENGGIIGVVNTPTQSVASGVWALEDQYNARVGDIWPIPYPYSMDFLVVAGGASGGLNGGGGGAGGYRTSTQTISGASTVITVTVGDGGASITVMVVRRK